MYVKLPNYCQSNGQTYICTRTEQVLPPFRVGVVLAQNRQHLQGLTKQERYIILGQSLHHGGII